MFRLSAPKSLQKHPPQLSKLTQCQRSTCPNTNTAQVDQIYPYTKHDQFWSRVTIAKQSDSTLQVIKKSIRADFVGSVFLNLPLISSALLSPAIPCNLIRV